MALRFFTAQGRGTKSFLNGPSVSIYALLQSSSLYTKLLGPSDKVLSFAFIGKKSSVSFIAILLRASSPVAILRTISERIISTINSIPFTRKHPHIFSKVREILPARIDSKMIPPLNTLNSITHRRPSYILKSAYTSMLKVTGLPRFLIQTPTALGLPAFSFKINACHNGSVATTAQTLPLMVSMFSFTGVLYHGKPSKFLSCEVDKFRHRLESYIYPKECQYAIL